MQRGAMRWSAEAWRGAWRAAWRGVRRGAACGVRLCVVALRGVAGLRRVEREAAERLLRRVHAVAILRVALRVALRALRVIALRRIAAVHAATAATAAHVPSVALVRAARPDRRVGHAARHGQRRAVAQSTGELTHASHAAARQQPVGGSLVLARPRELDHRALEVGERALDKHLRCTRVQAGCIGVASRHRAAGLQGCRVAGRRLAAPPPP